MIQAAETYLKVRRLTLFVAATLAFAALCAMSQQRVLEVPGIFGGGAGSLPLSAIPVLLLAVALAYSFSARHAYFEACAPRQLAVWDSGLFLAMLALVCAVLGLAALLFGIETATIVRHALLLCSATAIVGNITNYELGASAATLWLLTASVYGPRLDHTEYIRLFQPEALPEFAWALAAVLVLTSVASFYVPARLAFHHQGNLA
ncbi:hypothetical protein [Ornithinimicrobium sp. INDO-MA30-4]|uniref:hypothetical protein n=1 Tax=Ornithinimicrobium sp. INDO-MA30-4 TaxID=2908651 RepID=UPI001F3EAEE0|nr:hypothetical protein [Ornithinimicrobium sp. INDO-MA30-4]UJH71828.1 hypothetical protein L0A91_16650 [Ornithinimicrobium sp. INDO-MA30-4]